MRCTFPLVVIFANRFRIVSLRVPACLHLRARDSRSDWVSTRILSTIVSSWSRSDSIVSKSPNPLMGGWIDIGSNWTVPLIRLQAEQRHWRLSRVVSPPLLSGTIWSASSWRVALANPHHLHRLLSRDRTRFRSDWRMLVFMVNFPKVLWWKKIGEGLRPHRWGVSGNSNQKRLYYRLGRTRFEPLPYHRKLAQ